MQEDWRSRLQRTRPATGLLREVLEVQDEFRAELGSRLTVNPTDLAAMELLISQGPLSPSVLAHHLGLTTAATTTVVDRLVAVGHARREPNPTDRRSIRVVPDPHSVVAAISVIGPMIIAIDEILDDYGEEDQRVITRYLESVARVYRQHATPAGDIERAVADE